MLKPRPARTAPLSIERARTVVLGALRNETPDLAIDATHIESLAVHVASAERPHAYARSAVHHAEIDAHRRAGRRARMEAARAAERRAQLDRAADLGRREAFLPIVRMEAHLVTTLWPTLAASIASALAYHLDGDEPTGDARTRNRLQQRISRGLAALRQHGGADLAAWADRVRQQKQSEALLVAAELAEIQEAAGSC